MGNLVAPKLDVKFVKSKPITIAIALPNAKRMDFEGVIRSRSPPDDNKGIHYGIAFDLGKTQDAQRQQDVGVDYTLQCQHENYPRRWTAPDNHTGSQEPDPNPSQIGF